RYGSKLPRALEAIVSKATASAPEDRYPNVAEFAREVRRFVRGEEVHAYPDTLAAKLWRRLRRRPELVFGVVLGLLLVTSSAVMIALARELGARERADKQSNRMASLAAQVARTAATIDARAALADLVLEGLAAGASEAIDQPPRFPDDHRTPNDLAQDGGPIYIARYHQRVTFEHAVTLIPPWATGSEAAVSRSGDFERLLRRSAVRGTDDGAALERPAAEQSAIAREKSPFLWSSLGFESGVMMTFPGNTFFPVDYDPRKRSWYVTAVEKGKRGHVWGSPYPDATSGALIVPCATALYDHTDRLRGVAVMSLELDELLAQIAREDLEGFRASAVLDEKGDVVFWTGERGRILGAGVHENRTLERRPFGLAAVRSGVAGGARNGMVRAGDALVIYQRLTSFPWTLAVTLSAAPYSR
ncbi:MAG TPA: cache domain-containing protein, partial [Polyangiaceae bacterium]